MREIPLSKGYVALVDDEDYERVTAFKWSASESGENVYAIRRTSKRLGPSRIVYMHRFIMNADDSSYVDHKHHRTLDNRRSELRVTTSSGNSANQRLRRISNKSSQFKGVSRHGRLACWTAHIMVNYKRHYLGYFRDEAEAARAYDAAARHHFGEFALTNFPQEAAS